MLINRKQNKEKNSEQIKLNFGVAEGLAAENANLWYGDFQALKGITMDIPVQKVTAFIGPSGCGKSTFLKCFNRMNDLVDGCRIEGKFTVGGVDIYGKIDVNELRKNVGMVFQKPNPFPMSVYDNIAYGGQQQRLCIARALAASPSVLLMDEPTSALDPISTGKIEDLCDELKQSVTIVIVTHNMQQAVRISDKTGFFLLGELIEYGDTEKIFSAPENEKTKNYITGRFG